MRAAGTTTPRSLSVVIPAYNEETRLPKTVREIHSFLVERRYAGELLLVNDGSRDRTHEVMQALRDELPLVRVLSYSQNRGKGYAVRTGVMAANHASVLFSDADHSTPIADIDRLWPRYDDGCPVVVASRSLAKSEILIRQPIHRVGMGRVFNLIVSLLAVRGIQDTQCGFKLFSQSAARRIFSRVRTDGFAFDVEVLLRAREEGMRIAEVPVRWADAGGSRVRPGRDSIRMMMEILRMRGLV